MFYQNRRDILKTSKLKFFLVNFSYIFYFCSTVQTEDFPRVRQSSFGAVVLDFLRQDHEGSRDADRAQRQGRDDRSPRHQDRISGAKQPDCERAQTRSNTWYVVRKNKSDLY